MPRRKSACAARSRSLLLWVVLAGSLGVEVILGAFLAGAIIGQSRRSRSQIFEEKLDAMGYGFFIPIFFIMVGARFDLTALLASPGASVAGAAADCGVVSGEAAARAVLSTPLLLARIHCRPACCWPRGCR